MFRTDPSDAGTERTWKFQSVPGPGYPFSTASKVIKFKLFGSLVEDLNYKEECKHSAISSNWGRHFFVT